ncbi:uncharacterized protein MEPE_00056 [Melanopsichium pennsylvanicum]|uniref:Uncharacterized protein n=2 Tax=Melanopsichium pennsylvanicum TaxID=63383 RepID=A0AAJ4XFX8_9BASI|nr:uncharacterized protein BN887_02143 [Melanopsichium pennsylvanicum 4]SNX81351.1 uncharacterized protein MEPE_00056 [Melanopsichium pennsylvanicum]
MSYYCRGYGYSAYPCSSGLSNGTRIGIGIAIAVGVVLFIILFSTMAARRRRRRFTQQPAQTIPMAYQNGPPTNYYQGYNGGYSQASPYGQPGSGQAYGPPPGQPPAHDDDAALYAPPPGPPPPAYVPRDERKGGETANV